MSLFWSYSPIVLAPAVASVLVLLLQRWLRYPRKQPPAAATSPCTELVSATPAPPEKVTWADITTHRNEFVTTVVPVFAGAAILLLGIWPFAYIGWGFVLLIAEPGWNTPAPPWFGNLAYFLGLGVVGLFCAAVGITATSALVMGLHALGKCIVWPALCGCRDDSARADDAPADSHERAGPQ